ncbi:MAG: hypothetical protein PHD65_12875 [Gallionella sp.]|nr:hypothetical protein [Gallionella sp.]
MNTRVDEQDITGSDKARSFSIQAEIIRLIQVTKGQDSCYAAPVNGECSKTECSWRTDCFDEAGELFPALRVQQPVVAKSFDIPAEIIKLLQIGDVRNG